MKALVICSCGARVWVYEDAEGKFVCDDPTWRFGGEVDACCPGMTRAEIEAIPPCPGWHCGAPEHFQLLALYPDGRIFDARDLALFPNHATPAMFALMEQHWLAAKRRMIASACSIIERTQNEVKQWTRN